MAKEALGNLHRNAGAFKVGGELNAQGMEIKPPPLLILNWYPGCLEVTIDGELCILAEPLKSPELPRFPVIHHCNR